MRQLENALSAAVVRAFGEETRTLEPHHVFPDVPAHAGQGASFQESVRQFQRRLLVDALKRNDGNVAEAARSLGIARSHVYNLMRALGLERDP